MKNSLADYIRAAFSARPWGMWLPPNWIALATFGVLGFWEPGFWMVGAGLELAYLLILSHQDRFRAVVDGQKLLAQAERDQAGQLRELTRLDAARRERFRALQKKCAGILEEQHLTRDSSLLELQREGLLRLQAIHLKLLIIQSGLERMLAESGADPELLQAKMNQLQAEIQAEPAAAELNQSRGAQREILEKRLRMFQDAGEKFRFSESELARIEEQVALVGDEVRLASAPEAIGTQIDRISDGLEETNRWLAEQRRLFADTDTFDTQSHSSQTQ